MYFDYRMASRWAAKDDADGLTFTEYLSGLSGRLANLGGGAAAAPGMPTQLADMLPKPPEGWAVRAVDPADIDGFLPKSGKKSDPGGVAAIKAMVAGEAGSGVEVVAATYEKGDRKLIVKAVRYPNVIFSGTAATQQRIELQMMTAQFRGTEFATVRGLDVSEDLLPEGFRGRMFYADIGGQIHLRILAPKRMTDKELVPFLDTLHVKAMNADVVDQVEGLGDVPVIVLASALKGDARDAYLADVAARSAKEASELMTEQAQLDAEATAAEPATSAPADGGFLGKLFGGGDPAASETATPAAPEKTISCSTGKDGVKRCKVAEAEPAN